MEINYFGFFYSSQVYALSRDGGIPFSSIWRRDRVHPKRKVPAKAVWLCAAISIMLGLPILKLDVVYNAIVSLSIIGWVGSYAIPIFARLVMAEEHFKPGLLEATAKLRFALMLSPNY